jgi:type II secretory pathway component PulF
MGFIKPEFWLRSLVMGLLLLGISFLVTRYSSRGWQQLLMNLPVVGKLVQARSLLYLAQLQLPLSCGVPILTALELVREHIPDPVMAANLAAAARKIRIGQTLTSSLEGKLPPIAMQIIRTGEQTGNLDNALQNLGEYYEGELQRRLRLLESSLRPLSVLAIGALIASVGIRGITLLLNSLPG